MLKEVNFVHEHTRFSPVHARTVHSEHFRRDEVRAYIIYIT